MKRNQKKELLNKFLENENSDSDKNKLKSNEVVVEKNNSSINNKFLIIVFITIFFLILNIAGIYIIYNSVSKNNVVINTNEEEVLKLNEENQKVLDELKYKLINEIGYSEEEVNDWLNEFSSTELLSAIRYLTNKYDNSKSELDESIKALSDECIILNIDCKIDGTLVKQKSEMESIIVNEKNRLEKIAEEKREQQKTESIDNNVQNESNSVSSDVTSTGETSEQETQEVEQCYSSYDEAYQLALDKFLNNENIEKISVDSNNCPHYFDTNGNEI